MSTLTRPHELILSVGTTAGVVALVLPLLVPLRRTGRRLRPALRMPEGVAATARRLAIAGAVVLGSQDLATAAILRLANDRGASGAVVLFNLAWTVFLLPWAVLAVPVAIAAFPTLVSRWEAEDATGYAATAAMGTRTIVVACAAAAAALVGCAGPASRILVLGAPGGVAPHQLARALVAFAPGLIGFAAIALLSRVHYARGDARTPALATAAGWLAVVAADVALVVALPRDWTAAALGIGTSIGMTLAALWMVVVLGRNAPECLRGVGRSTLAAVAAGAAAAAAGVALAHVLPTGGVAVSTGETAVVAVLGLAVFLVLSYLLDRQTVLAIARRGRRVR